MKTRLGALAALFAGLVLTGFGAWKTLAAWESRSWPVAAGVVQRSLVERGVHGRHGRRYRAQVEYAYSVDGRYYRSSRISFGDAATGFRAPARWIVSRYPVASEVVVHYDPADPESAVLVTGMTIGSGGIVLVGLGVCAGSLLAGCSPRRLERLIRRAT
jgi:hypothetical protein